MGTPPPRGQTEGQTHVKTLPSRRTTYAGGKYVTNVSFENGSQFLHYSPCTVY